MPVLSNHLQDLQQVMVSGPNLNETSIVSGGYGGTAEGIIPTSSIKGVCLSCSVVSLLWLYLLVFIVFSTPDQTASMWLCRIAFASVDQFVICAGVKAAGFYHILHRK